MRYIILLLLLSCVVFSTRVACASEFPKVEARELLADRAEKTKSSSKTTSTSSETTKTTHKSSTITSVASKSKTTSSSSISVDPRLPAGGVSMITPAVTDSETFIKVGDYATFSWNYTSLVVAPTAVNVEAYCSMNDFYYPIAQNISVNETKVVWNTSGYDATATTKLIVATYTLFIYDAGADVTAVASAGHLGVYDNLMFGVYTPQAYTPLDQFKCATCSNAAFSIIERNIIRGTLLMATLVALSATVFMMR